MRVQISPVPPNIMKRPRKFYRDKELKRRVREIHEHWKTESNYYWKHQGYSITMVPSRVSRKHPLYKELKEILPLVTEIHHRDKPEIDTYEYKGVRKELYNKLTPLQKSCLVKTTIPGEYQTTTPGKLWPETQWYTLDPKLKELLVPRITRYYRHEYCSRHSSLDHKMTRDNIWALVGPKDRENDKCGRKAKHKKALIKYAKEEIMEML